MEFQNLLELIEKVSASSLTNFKYEDEDVKMSMNKEQHGTASQAGIYTTVSLPAAAPAVPQAPAAAPQAAPAAVQAPEASGETEGNLVKSPLVGTFYAAPSEDADPFVAVGDQVKKGQILAIVEAMKLMNEIECEFDGTVAEIYAGNQEAVEYGQPLFRII